VLGTPQAPSSVDSPTSTPFPTPTNVPLPDKPVPAGDANPDEPVFIAGDIPYTSPFFINTLVEPLVLLEDQAGFVNREMDFTFPLAGQTIGPVEILPDDSLRYSLSLPSIPQGTYVDVDNDGETDTGVQVFAIAYWSNVWGGPFLEERDGYGWSTGSASTTADPNRNGEIDGGILLVWSPDDQQAFPTDWGEDNMLFTEDDPTDLIPAGYTFVNLDETPFRFYKEAQPFITLKEGVGALNDYMNLSYEEAFATMFEKVSVEYPFTAEKNIDWDVLRTEFAEKVADANTQTDFYEVLKEFTLRIPDGHVGLSFDAQNFYDKYGGSFGLVLAELDDGTVLVTEVLPNTSGERADIEVGAEIIAIDERPVADAIERAVSAFGPYSVLHAERRDQLLFATRFPPLTRVEWTWRNPGESTSSTATLSADVDYDSLFAAIAGFDIDELALPLEGEILDASGLGYIKITTFSDDYNLMARLWGRFIDDLLENEVDGLIIDVRVNGGGSGGMARDFAGYFFEEAFDFGRRSYYNERTDMFEYLPQISTIEPGPEYYDGDVVVLVSTDCASACEAFAYALQHDERATVLGHTPTAGMFGEVGRGQYKMPGDYSMQFPTGRPENLDGTLQIEGVGVLPDITVPVTRESVLGEEDTVLQAAIDFLK
jgi:C-terminal processing protease CtpA/Prc